MSSSDIRRLRIEGDQAFTVNNNSTGLDQCTGCIRQRRRLKSAWIFFLLFFASLEGATAYQVVPNVKRWSQEVKTGYQRRIAADPLFPQKSVTEVLLAAGTQLAAEWSRRGAIRLIPEADFVIPAILTAVFGKYYRCVMQFVRFSYLFDHRQPESMSNFWAKWNFYRSSKPIPLE